MKKPQQPQDGHQVVGGAVREARVDHLEDHPIPQPVPEPHPGRAPGDGGLGGLGPQVLALRHKLLLLWYFEGFWNWFSIKMLYQIFSIYHKNVEWQKILLNSRCT